MKNKAIIFDLDGTAVDSPISNVPSKLLIKELQRLKSKYYLCAATGRNWSFGGEIIKLLKLEDPCVISAGTQIYDPQKNIVVWQKNIHKEDLNAALSIIKDYKNISILFNNYTEADYYSDHNLVGGIDNTDEIFFLEMIYVPNDVAQEIEKKFAKISGLTVLVLNSLRPNCKDIHITNREATKEHAIQELLKMLGVNKANTIGIGDGGNDIHLFNAVNYKVAMGNGVDAIKNSADIIIGDVSDDGLAKYLETL